MKFEFVPLDILETIVKVGQLSVDEVLLLSCTCHLLRSKLTSESIWSRLFELNWGHILTAYGFPTSSQSSFDKSMQFNNRQHEILKLVESYTPRGDNNITVILDTILADTTNVIILINIYHLVNPKIDLSSQSIDISRVALVLNLIQACNYKLGFKFVTDFYSHPNQYESFEEVCLQFDRFNSSFSTLVNNRSKKLAKIRKLLYQDIYINYLKYKKSPHVVLNGDKLKFKNEKALVLFGFKVAKAILSLFSCKNINQDYIDIERYFDDFYLEDYSIMHIYADMVKGHPLSLMCILIEELTKFFSKFKIYIDKVHINLEFILTKNFIKFQSYYIFLRPRNTIRTPYSLDVFTYRQVTGFLRENFGYGESQIRNYLQPLTAWNMMEIFMTIKIPSITSIVQQDKLNFDSPLMPTWTVKDFQFVQFVIRLLIYQPMGGYRDYHYCSQFHKYLTELNYFIHLKSIYSFLKTDEAKAMLMDYFSKQSTLAHFQFPQFTLTAPDMDRFYATLRDTILPPQVGYSDNFTTGSVVHHQRFNTYSIVIGSIQERGKEYIYVYSTSDTIEVYESGSISRKIDAKDSDFLHIKHFYNQCRRDILGLLYFQAIDTTNVNFIPFNSPQ